MNDGVQYYGTYMHSTICVCGYIYFFACVYVCEDVDVDVDVDGHVQAGRVVNRNRNGSICVVGHVCISGIRRTFHSQLL